MLNKDNLNSNWKDLIAKYFGNTCTKEELSQILKLIGNEKNVDGLTQILKENWEKLKSENTNPTLDLDSKFSMLMKEARQGALFIQSNPVKEKRKGNGIMLRPRQYLFV